MDIVTIINDALLVLNAAEKIARIGMDAAPRIADAIAILSGDKVMSTEERNQLIAQQQDLETRIDKAVEADDAATGPSGAS